TCRERTSYHGETTNIRLNRSSFALASGLGFGLIYALTTYVSLLSQSLGPGSPMSPACPNISIFFLSVAFDGYFQPMSAWRIGFVVLTHFTVAYTTTINSNGTNYGCVYPLLVNSLIFIITGGLAAASVLKHHA
ncbi:hypothetical protein BDF22DRAFT_698279, partial [Syncephalis plumigaleata]